ncbi:phosphotransferase family protein [Marinicellulosiphila megalodicopiae]|uniref:phosphotransferase family protein n=1 Tax=Marinicellulosiphila megalodicopiae TaxID=2724896 RepID=UPI003BB080F7
MRSNTKITLDKDTIKKLSNKAFGPKQISDTQELTYGWFNTAYKITFNDQTTVVLKVGPPQHAPIMCYEKNMMQAEINCTELVSKRLNIPSPKVLFSDLTKQDIDYPYFFMDFMPGIIWNTIRDDLSEDQNNQLLFQLGEITAKINSIQNAHFGYFDLSEKHTNWFDAFSAMSTQLFNDAKTYNIKLPLTQSEYTTLLNDYQSIFAEVTQAQLVHWDLSPSNIFIDEQDHCHCHILGAIDFERAIWGDPLMESILFDKNNIEAYSKGYQQNLLTTDNQKSRRLFYNLYLCLIIVIEDGPRDYDDKSAVIWANDELVKIADQLNRIKK